MRPQSQQPIQQLRSVYRRYPGGSLAAATAASGNSFPRLIASAPVNEPQESAEIKIRRVEAVLFLSREPLPSRKLSQYANLEDGTEARTLVRKLNKSYDQTGRAFRVEEVAGGYQLMTRYMFSPWLRRLNHAPAPTRLSAPAMETLAVVAYRQPVLRAAVEAIRGVSSGEILRQLMERDLVRISGRSEELGRPYLYSTTKHFLQIFGLNCLDNLPRTEVIYAPEGEATNATSNPDDPDVTVDRKEEESDVSALTETQFLVDEPDPLLTATLVTEPVKNIDDDDDFDDDDWDDDDDDDWDDDDDFDDDLDDDLDDDEEVDEDEEEEIDDDDWEEVDDDDDLEDDDWDDEDDDDELEDDDDEEEYD